MMASRISRRRLLQAGAGLTTLTQRTALAAGPIEKSKLIAAIPVDAASFLPIYLAAGRTWKSQGLDVELTAFRGDAEVSQALIGGSIDFSIQSADGLINMINAGQPVIAFYAGFHQSDYAWLSQPAIKSWDALKGKTAGVSTFGSATDQLTRYALRRHGLVPEKDVQIVQAGPPASIAQALKAERLAIGILAPPMNWMVADADSTYWAARARRSPRNGPSTSSWRGKNFSTTIPTPCGRSWPRMWRPSAWPAPIARSWSRPIWSG